MAKITSFNWGFIVIDGKQYIHDVLILPDGVVMGRDPGKSRVGSHSVTSNEMEYLSEAQPDVIVVGTGMSGLMKLADDTVTYLRKANLNVMTLPSPQAVTRFNQLTGEGKRVAALIHITC